MLISQLSEVVEESWILAQNDREKQGYNIYKVILNGTSSLKLTIGTLLFPYVGVRSQFLFSKNKSIYYSINKLIKLLIFSKLCSANPVLRVLIICYYYSLCVQTSYYVSVPSYLYRDLVCAWSLAILKQTVLMSVTYGEYIP